MLRKYTATVSRSAGRISFRTGFILSLSRRDLCKYKAPWQANPSPNPLLSEPLHTSILLLVWYHTRTHNLLLRIIHRYFKFMISMSFKKLYLLSLCAVKAATASIPTAPGLGDVFKAGSDCLIKWDIDTIGAWNNVSIDFMTGSTKNMTLLTNVAYKLDGTSNPIPFDWVCPLVNPNSAIYFYRFSNGNNKTSALYTPRFTITSASGASTPPEHSAQPDGQPIPWGEGHMATITKQSKAIGKNAEPHSATIHEPEEPSTEVPPESVNAPDQDPPVNTTAPTTKFSSTQYKIISIPYHCSWFAKDGGMEEHNAYEEYGGAFVLLSFIVLWIWC